MPCGLYRQHAGLGAGVRESQHLHRLDSIAQIFCKGDLVPRRSRPGSAPLHDGLNCLARGPVVIAVDQTQAIAEQIHVTAFIDIPQPGTIATIDNDRIWRVKTRGARVSSGQYRGSLVHESRGSRSLASVTLFDETARASTENSFARNDVGLFQKAFLGHA